MQPPYFRVNLVVLHYPLEFWHLSFFKQLTSSFGCTVYIADGNAKGNDRTSLRLLIRAVDPLRISKTIVILHEERWKRCRVVVKGWYREGVTSPASPFPWQGGEMQDSEYRGRRICCKTQHLENLWYQLIRSFFWSLREVMGVSHLMLTVEVWQRKKVTGSWRQGMHRVLEERTMGSVVLQGGLSPVTLCFTTIKEVVRSGYDALRQAPCGAICSMFTPPYYMRGIHMKTTTCTGKRGLPRLQRIRVGAECIQIFSGPLRKGIFPGCKRIEFRHVAQRLYKPGEHPPQKTIL